MTKDRMIQFKNTFKDLDTLIKSYHKEIFGDKEWHLMKYGSTVNSLCHRTDSDLDLTVIVNDFDVSHEVILKSIKRMLESTVS